MMDHPLARDLQIPISISAAYAPSVRDIASLQIYAANNGNNKSSGSGDGDGDGNGNGVSNNTNSNSNNNANSSEADKIVSYRECQKNHAANLGSHAVDGCGEFMADGDEGTPGALKCAACGCHRNFHRREVEGEEGEAEGEGSYERKVHAPFSRDLISHASAPRMLMALSSGGLGESDDQDGAGVGLLRRGSVMKKRFRTKFSQHQKERMYAFADQLGWRIQKHDEGAVQQFCNEVGVRRHVLKVWMHNNKHTLGKKA